MVQMQQKNKIIDLEKKRAAILNSLLELWPVIAGSYGEIYRKCGKPNCWCRKGKGHPLRRVTWTDENRKSRTKAVSEKDKASIIAAIENHRNYRRKLKKIVHIEEAIHQGLKNLMYEKIKKSWNREV